MMMMMMMMMMMSFWIIFSLCPAGKRPSRGAPPTPAERPRHARPTRQHKVLSAKGQASTPNSASGGRRTDPSRGRIDRSPGTEEIAGGGGVSSIFGGVSLQRFCLSCLLVGVSIVWKAFFSGNRTLYHPPRGYSIRIPGYFRSAVESDSVRTGQWFEPCLLSFFFVVCFFLHYLLPPFFFGVPHFFSLFVERWACPRSSFVPGTYFLWCCRGAVRYIHTYIMRTAVL